MRTGLACLLFVAACGGGASTSVDASAAVDATVDAPVAIADAQPRFACADQPLPTTAPATIDATGVTETVTLQGAAAVPMVAVAAYPRGGGAAIVSATSDTNGTFALAVTTGGTPVDGYLLATKTGYLETYLYPPAPMAVNTDRARMLMVTPQLFGQLQAVAMAESPAGKGFVGVVVADCDGAPVAGATVTAPSGVVRYTTGGLPSMNATVTGDDGLAMLFGVEPGTITVAASGGGGTYRSHDIDVRADVVTTTVVQP